MQSFDTDSSQEHNSPNSERKLVIGSVRELPAGTSVRVPLPDGGELAVFNVDGEYYAIDNLCPHRGASLSEGTLCGHVIECWLHGWQFDVRTGECLTVSDRIHTYDVIIEDDTLLVILK